jgi:hypothetical protein
VRYPRLRALPTAHMRIEYSGKKPTVEWWRGSTWLG